MTLLFSYAQLLIIDPLSTNSVYVPILKIWRYIWHGHFTGEGKTRLQTSHWWNSWVARMFSRVLAQQSFLKDECVMCSWDIQNCQVINCWKLPQVQEVTKAMIWFYCNHQFLTLKFYVLLVVNPVVNIFRVVAQWISLLHGLRSPLWF